MPQNRNKTIVPWTYRHDEYCLKNGLPPAAKLLWKWLLRHSILNAESEIDLNDFNRWIAKSRGKGYCQKTLKGALEKIYQSRVIELCRQYTWRIVKIITRPIEYLKPRKKVQKRDIFSNSGVPNPRNSVTQYQQQQQLLIIRNQTTLSDFGITFNSDEKEVLEHPHNEVLLAIECFKLRGGFGKIPNPQGWVRVCLRKRFWDEMPTYNQLLMKFGNCTYWDELFPNTQ